MKKTTTILAAFLLAAFIAPAQAASFGTSAEAKKTTADQVAKFSKGSKSKKAKTPKA